MKCIRAYEKGRDVRPACATGEKHRTRRDKRGGRRTHRAEYRDPPFRCRSVRLALACRWVSVLVKRGRTAACRGRVRVDGMTSNLGWLVLAGDVCLPRIHRRSRRATVSSTRREVLRRSRERDRDRQADERGKAGHTSTRWIMTAVPSQMLGSSCVRQPGTTLSSVCPGCVGE